MSTRNHGFKMFQFSLSLKLFFPHSIIIKNPKFSSKNSIFNKSSSDTHRYYCYYVAIVSKAIEMTTYVYFSMYMWVLSGHGDKHSQTAEHFKLIFKIIIHWWTFSDVPLVQQLHGNTYTRTHKSARAPNGPSVFCII